MVLALVSGCDQNSAHQNDSQSIVLQERVSEQQVSSGARWLNSIFQCKSSNGYCLPDQNMLFAERYLEFHQETLKLFEYPDFETKDERVAAEKVYKNKWGNIYPLGQEVLTPFGMGNGMQVGDRLANVAISHIVDFEYSVLVDYGENIVFSNKVRLIPADNTFFIDYIETTLIK